jgi:uncharacterized membrane protein YeaQ/YmgE (transglycosylase-associated protein family)
VFVTEPSGLWRFVVITFADFTLEPGGIIAWVIVGLIAGALAGRVMKGSGYGIIGDLVVGLVGAVVGGWLFGLLLVGGNTGIVGSIVIAFLGACALIMVVRAVAPGRSEL